MVCVPCFIIPVLLWLYHRFLQPYVLRWWNPWQGRGSEGQGSAPAASPFDCSGGVCKFSFGTGKRAVEPPGVHAPGEAAEALAEKPKAD